jgi:hypothetical protein
LTQKINEAILTILGTLPTNAEIHFFWQEGCPHMSMKLPGEKEQIARLNRQTDGTGIVVPAKTH